MTVVLDGLDGVRRAAGRPIGRSDWLEVCAATVAQFVGAVGAGDPSGPIPPDLILALTNRLLPTVVEVTGVSLGVNYGVDALRFGPPLPVGARIRLGVDLLDVADVAGGVQTRMGVVLEAAGQSGPACALEALSRYYA